MTVLSIDLNMIYLLICFYLLNKAIKTL